MLKLRRLVLSLLLFTVAHAAYAVTGGGITPPAGPVNAIQFDKRGSFGGDANFTYSTATKTETVPKINASTVTGVALLQFQDGSSQTTAGGGGGSGDITSVTAGQGLLGGGLTGAVTLHLDPSTTEYLQNAFGTGAHQSNSAIYPDSATIEGRLNVRDPLHGSMTFDPASGDNNLILDNQSIPSLNGAITMRWLGSDILKLNTGISQATDVFSLGLSSKTNGGALTSRYLIGRVNGKHSFLDSQGAVIVEFDPTHNSSFTIPVVTSSASITNLNTTTLKFNDGTTQTTASVGGGGSGTTIQVQQSGSNIVNTSTLNVLNGIKATSVSGKGQFEVDWSSAISRTDVSAAYQPLDATLTDLAAAPLTEDNSIDPTAIGPGATPADVRVSSVALNGFYSDANVRTNLGLSIGTDVQGFDADLTDLADGSLTGSKVGSGVPAANIASGNLGSAVKTSSADVTAFYSDALVRAALGLAIGTSVQAYDADLDDLADGSLSGSKVGSGVPAANIASGILGSAVVASSASATMLVSSLNVTGVTAGSYTNGNFTVDAYGHLSAASNGSAGGGSFSLSITTGGPNGITNGPPVSSSSVRTMIVVDSRTFTTDLTGGTTIGVFLKTSSVTLAGPDIDLGSTEATGTLAAGRFPALTGPVTTSAGSLVTVIGAAAVQPSNVVSTTAYTTDTTTDTFNITIATNAWSSFVIPIAQLGFVNGSTITQVLCETIPSGSTVTFSLESRSYQTINTAGTSLFSVTYSTANSDGKTIALAASTLVAAKNVVTLVTPAANTSAGGTTSLSVHIWYLRKRDNQ